MSYFFRLTEHVQTWKSIVRLGCLFVLLAATSFMAVACANSDDSSPVYKIGDTGPSGVGTVFYLTDASGTLADQSGSHGLEIAPVGWEQNLSDVSNEDVWIDSTATAATEYVNSSGTALPAGIGTGYANTKAIVAATSTGKWNAAARCNAYTGGGKSDWFLPSKDELQQINTAVIAGLVTIYKKSGDSTDYYWSSTEKAANTAWFLEVVNNSSDATIKSSSTCYMVPVRSF